MKMLRITSLGIVQSDNGFEMVLEDFLKKLEKQIKKANYSVIYNEEDDNFNIVYNGKEYLLELDNEEMDNEIISKLKMLSDIKSCELKKENEKQRREKIIKDADEGILPDDEAKSIYLNILKKQKLLLAEIKEYFSDPDFPPTEFFKALFAMTVLGASIGLIPLIVFGEKPVTSIVTLIGAALGFSFFPVGCSIEILQKYVRKQRVLKHKIRELEKSLNIDKSKSNKKVKKNNKHKNKNVVINNNEVQESIKSYLYNFKDTIYHKVSGLLDKIDSLKNNDKVRTQRKTKTHGKNKVQTKTIPSISINFGEQVKSYPYNFKDTIYQRASGLLDKIDSLNNDVKKIELKGKINGILQEYRTGLTLEQNVGPVELSVSKCKSIPDLKSEIRNKLGTRLGSKLDNIDTYINEMLEKQITESEREKERLLLEERLGPIVIDSEEIDGTLRERAENKVPVRGRKKELSRVNNGY